MGTLKDTNTKTQVQEILAYLADGNGLTSLQSDDLFGARRLASRIHNIKELGHSIYDEFVKVNNRKGKKVWVKKYYLKDFAPENATPTKPKVSSKAQKRFEAAEKWFLEQKAYDNSDLFDQIDQALKIAAGIKH